MTDQAETAAPPTMSVEEAGKLLGIGKYAAYAAVHRGDIPTIRIGKLIRVPRVRLERLLEGVRRDRAHRAARARPPWTGGGARRRDVAGTATP